MRACSREKGTTAPAHTLRQQRQGHRKGVARACWECLCSSVRPRGMHAASPRRPAIWAASQAAPQIAHTSPQLRRVCDQPAAWQAPAHAPFPRQHGCGPSHRLPCANTQPPCLCPSCSGSGVRATSFHPTPCPALPCTRRSQLCRCMAYGRTCLQEIADDGVRCQALRQAALGGHAPARSSRCAHSSTLGQPVHVLQLPSAVAAERMSLHPCMSACLHAYQRAHMHASETVKPASSHCGVPPGQP